MNTKDLNPPVGVSMTTQRGLWLATIVNSLLVIATLTWLLTSERLKVQPPSVAAEVLRSHDYFEQARDLTSMLKDALTLVAEQHREIQGLRGELHSEIGPEPSGTAAK